MKKIAAILLLFLHLYSLVGDTALHQYLTYCADKFFNEQASKGLYNTHDLEEVKVPVNLPGIRDWVKYENISGQIRFGNNAYNYVQMRVTRHALFLKCIPNYRATILNAHNILHAEPIKDIPVPQKEHVPPVKVIQMDFLDITALNVVLESPLTTITPFNTAYFQPETSCYIVMPKQPPRHLG